MLRLHDDAHPVLTDDGGAILNARTGRWTHLTPTAAAAVMIMCCAPLAEAAEQYATRYQLSTERARADLRTVADGLATAGLTTRRAARTGLRARWRR